MGEVKLVVTRRLQSVLILNMSLSINKTILLKTQQVAMGLDGVETILVECTEGQLFEVGENSVNRSAPSETIDRGRYIWGATFGIHQFQPLNRYQLDGIQSGGTVDDKIRADIDMNCDEKLFQLAKIGQIFQHIRQITCVWRSMLKQILVNQRFKESCTKLHQLT